MIVQKEMAKFFMDQVIGDYDGHMAPIPNNPVLNSIATAYGIKYQPKQFAEFLRGIADALDDPFVKTTVI
jgi:hypothetical protein